MYLQSFHDPATPAAQVLFENLPVALAAVDCEGTEASITECQSNDNLIGECTNITSSTVLACADSANGMWLAVSKHKQLYMRSCWLQISLVWTMLANSVLRGNRMATVCIAPQPDIITV